MLKSEDTMRLRTEQVRSWGSIVATMELVPRSRSAERASQWRCSCEWNGRTFEAVSRRGASHALCRELLAAGCPDQAMQVIGPDGELQFALRSIHKAAGRMVTESPTHPIAETTYVEPMGAVAHPNGQNRGKSPEPVPGIPPDRIPPILGIPAKAA